MFKALRQLKWKVFALLFTGGLLGVIAILPFAADAFGSIPQDTTVRDLPLPVVLALALLQNGILLAITIIVGMLLSERVGLRMPLIRAWAGGTRPQGIRRILLPGLFVGGAVGAVLVALEGLFFLRYVPATMQPMFEIPLWKRLLAGVVYGGITEELFMRLFLLSLLVWLLGRWWKAADGRPATGAFWVAIIVTALLFGLGHLPATAMLAPLTPPLVVRALVLNGVAGVAFGYLYWRRGLEASMAAHIGTHLVLQAPGVILLTRML